MADAMSQKRLLAWVLLLLWIQPAPAADEKKIDFSEVEKVAAAEMADTNAPGAAIAVVRGDRVIYSRGFGVASAETGEPVRPEMLFRLGSTTKMFTAAALATLAEHGKLRLDEPIGTYVKGLNPKLARVTAHQLLSHTAGIWDEAPMFGPHDDKALGEGIRAWKDDPCFIEPGRIFSYSNPGYWVAGLVIEEVGGKRYADQVSESVFKPLGMSRSTFRPTTAMTYPLAQGHLEAPAGGKPPVLRPAADNASGWPAGSMFSSVEELARFVIAFLNEGRIDGQQALAPAVIARMSAAQVSLPGGERQYGYGLGRERLRGAALVEHGGARAGYGSLIRMAPVERVGVITVTNRSGIGLSRTSEKALELLLPLEPKADSKPKAEMTMSEPEMDRYRGSYGNNATTFEILAKEGKLYRKQGGRETQLAKVGERRVRASASGPEAVFVAGPDGAIEYLHVGGHAFKKIGAR